MLHFHFENLLLKKTHWLTNREHEAMRQSCQQLTSCKLHVARCTLKLELKLKLKSWRQGRMQWLLVSKTFSGNTHTHIHTHTHTYRTGHWLANQLCYRHQLPSVARRKRGRERYSESETEASFCCRHCWVGQVACKQQLMQKVFWP